MWRLSVLIILSITNLTFVRSEPNLIFLQTHNGIEEPISSVFKIKTGKNVSLTCKTIDVISNQNPLSDLVTWSKELIHPDEFKNEISNKIVNMSEQSQLNFKPVRMDDQGTYFCKNTKYNLSKKLQVIVEYYKKTLDSRWKRAQYNYGHGYPWGAPTPKPPGVRNNNIPMHIQDMVDNLHRSVHENNWNTLHNTNNENPFWQQNQNVHWNKEELVEIKKYSKKPPVVASPKQSYAVFYFLGGGIAVLLLFGGLCVLAQNHNNGTRRVPVNAIPLPFHGFPAPGTTGERTEPVQEPPTLYTSLIDPDNSTGMNRSNLQGRRHSVAVPLVSDVAPMMSNADAPPSYDYLARNDPSTAPPSYDEAMTNFGVRLLNPALSRITEGLQNVVLSAPVVSQNDI